MRVVDGRIATPLGTACFFSRGVNWDRTIVEHGPGDRIAEGSLVSGLGEVAAVDSVHVYTARRYPGSEGGAGGSHVGDHFQGTLGRAGDNSETQPPIVGRFAEREGEGRAGSSTDLADRVDRGRLIEAGPILDGRRSVWLLQCYSIRFSRNLR